MKAEETIDFPIRWAWHHISRLYNAEAAKYGASLSLGYILLNIDLENGTPSTSLGPKLGMEPTSLVRTIKRMEELELLERRPCQTDKRKVFLHLTDLGLEKRELSKSVVKRFNKELQSHIPKEELNSFLQTMGKINNILTNEEIFK
jgi:DNA-binding MarR family transcriptional regulator